MSYHHNRWLTITLLILAIGMALFNNSTVDGGIQNETLAESLNDTDKVRKMTIGDDEQVLMILWLLFYQIKLHKQIKQLLR